MDSSDFYIGNRFDASEKVLLAAVGLVAEWVLIYCILVVVQSNRLSVKVLVGFGMSVQLNEKVSEILAGNSKLKLHYDFLLKKKIAAEKALDEFVQRLEREHEGLMDHVNKDPSEIDDYDRAVDYINAMILKDEDKLREIKKYITQQQEMEEVWEYTHKRYTADDKTTDEMMNEFYKYMMTQLEDFSKRCHQKFFALKIPLFCIKKDKVYKNINKDRRKLISYIQDQLNSE